MATPRHTQAKAHCQGEAVTDGSGRGRPHPGRASDEGEHPMAPPWPWNLGSGLTCLVHRKSPFPLPSKPQANSHTQTPPAPPHPPHTQEPLLKAHTVTPTSTHVTTCTHLPTCAVTHRDGYCLRHGLLVANNTHQLKPLEEK